MTEGSIPLAPLTYSLNPHKVTQVWVIKMNAYFQMQVLNPYDIEIILLQDLDLPPIQAIRFEVP